MQNRGYQINSKSKNIQHIHYQFICSGHHYLDHHHVVYFNEMMSADESVSNPRRPGLPGGGHASVRSGHGYIDEGKASPLYNQQPRQERANRRRSTSNLLEAKNVQDACERKKQLQAKIDLDEIDANLRAHSQPRPINNNGLQPIHTQKPKAEVRRPYARLEAELEADSDDSDEAPAGGFRGVGASSHDGHFLARQEERDLFIGDLLSDSQPDEESPFEFTTVRPRRGSRAQNSNMFLNVPYDPCSDSPQKDQQTSGAKSKDQYDSAASFSRKHLNKGGMLAFLFEDDEVDPANGEQDSNGADQKAWSEPRKREQIQQVFDARGFQQQRPSHVAHQMYWTTNDTSNQISRVPQFNQMTNGVAAEWAFNQGAQLPQNIVHQVHLQQNMQAQAALQRKFFQLEMLQQQLPPQKYFELLRNEQFMYASFQREKNMQQQMLHQVLPHQYHTQQPNGLLAAFRCQDQASSYLGANIQMPNQFCLNNQQQLIMSQQQQMQFAIASYNQHMHTLAAQTNDPYRGYAFGMSPRPINKYERLFKERVAAKLGFSGNHQSAFKVGPGYQRLFDMVEPQHQPYRSLGSEAARVINSQQLQFNQQRNKRPNRLIEITRGLQAAHENLHRYRRARQEVLEKIRRGRDKQGVNYIGNSTEEDGYPEEQAWPDEWHQVNPVGKDLGGLGQQGNRVGQFNDAVRREKATRRMQNEEQEVGLGTGGEYVLRRNQIIESPEGHRYKIVGYLGQGTFGQVVKCINLQTHSQHAIKIIKNKQEFILQGLVEAKILEKLNESCTEFEKQHLIKMQDYFVFRDYLCIVFELLSKSLYSIVQETDRGLPLPTVRDYVRQTLEALVACESANLIHCDLKPENILVADDGVNVKLIDFGNATFNGHQVYTYIQSRYYRAPEVLMGSFKVDQATGQRSPFYDKSIDMWSLGCTAIELFIKTPIFPGMHDYDQMLKIQEFCGQPPIDLISNSLNRDKFFLFNYFQRCYMFKTFQQFQAALQANYAIPQNYHQYRNFCQLLESHHILKLKKREYDFALSQRLPVPPRFDMMRIDYGQNEQREIYQFIDFIQQILQVDPRKRLTPLQALSHPFITGEINWPIPFPVAPNHQLRQFREALLLNHGHAMRRQRVPRPFHKFSMQEFFKYEAPHIQRNGAESFRPALFGLPEELFFGNCQETLQSFLEESKIRFQIHQDENMQDQIYRQKELLQGHRFCDSVIETCGLADILDPEDDDEPQQEPVSARRVQLQRQESVQKIRADKTIIQPKSQVLSGNPQAFIRDLLQKEILGRLDKQVKSNPKTSVRKHNEVQYQSSFDFQLAHFEDFFFGPEEEKFKLEAINEQNDDDCCKKDDVDDFKKMSKVTTLCGYSDIYTSSEEEELAEHEKNVSSIFCDQDQWVPHHGFKEMRADIEKFNKERSGSSDDLQRNQQQHSSAQQVTAAGHFSQVFGSETVPKPFFVPETRNEKLDGAILMTPGIVDKNEAATSKHNTSPVRSIGLAHAVVGSFHEQKVPKAGLLHRPHDSKRDLFEKEVKSEEEFDDASDIDTEQDTEYVRYAKQRREAMLENTDSVDNEELKDGERIVAQHCSSRQTEANQGTEDDFCDEGPWLLSSTLSDETGGFGGGRHRNLSNSYEDRKKLLGDDSDQQVTSDKTSFGGSNSFKQGGGIPCLRNVRLAFRETSQKEKMPNKDMKEQRQRRSRPITRAYAGKDQTIPSSTLPEN